MIPPRWRKVLADVWSSFSRSVMITASIAVGLFAIGIITTLYIVLQRDMQQGYASVNPANVQMVVVNLTDDAIRNAENVRGVKDAEAVQTASMRVLDSSGEWETLTIHINESVERKLINRLELVSGRWPQQAREIVIDQYKFKKFGVSLGEEISVELPNRAIRRMRVVGVVKDQTIGSSGAAGGFFMAGAQGYVNSTALGWLNLNDAPDMLFITAERAGMSENELRSLGDKVRDVLEENSGRVVSQSVRNTYDHPNSTYTDAVTAVLFVLGALVLFLSSILVTNTFQALLNQQVKQIGIMKILGARSGQIIGIYTSMIFLFGIVAFAISLPLSNRAAQNMMQYLSNEINTTVLEFHTVPLAAGIMLVLALIVPQIAGFFPILQGVRISVQEATSGIQQKFHQDVIVTTRFSKALLKVLPRPILVSLRNTVRRRGRLILTLITLSLGGSIFIGTFNVRASIDNYINRVGQYFLADINLTLERSYHTREIEEVLKKLPQVKSVEGWGGAIADILRSDGLVADTTSILAAPANSALVNPILLSGRWLEAGDYQSIAISERYQEIFPGIQPGDVITLRLNGKETRFKVVGCFQLVGSAGGYVAYTTFEDLNRLIGLGNRTNTYKIASNKQGMSSDEQTELAHSVEDYLEKNGYKVKEIQPGQALNNNATQGLNVLTYVLLIMALLTALVGSIGLAGTMSLNVMERRREIGVLRAIGASDRKVMNIVLVEGLVIGMMSWVLGAFASLPISKMLSNAIFFALFGTDWSVSYDPTGYLLWLVLVLVLSLVSSLLPGRSAARLTIREVLAYE